MYTAQTTDDPKETYIYGKRYKEVERKVAEAMGDAAKGVYFDHENTTVSEYMTKRSPNPRTPPVGP